MEKKLQGKQNIELLATIHVHMDCLIIYLKCDGEICVLSGMHVRPLLANLVIHLPKLRMYVDKYYVCL